MRWPVAGLLFCSFLLSAYTPGEYAIDVDAQTDAFIAACAAGEDADTNVYDSVADYTSARLNDAAKRFHCFEKINFEGAATVIVTRDGASFANARVYGDPDCGNGDFYETPSWGLRANGFAGAGINGAWEQAASPTLEHFDVRADNIIVHCFKLTDPDLDGPAGPLGNVRNADHVVWQYNYFVDPSLQNLFRVSQNNSNIWFQYNVGHCTQASGNRNLFITLIVNNAAGDQQNIVVTGNESWNCGDSFQTLENSNDADNATDYFRGIVVENNDFYVTDDVYIDCNTGAWDTFGDCACAENAIDVKIANQDGTTPMEISATAWAATTAYSLGAIRRPTTRNGWAYVVVTAGTSGGSQPTWPTAWHSTVTDGSVTWRAFFDRYSIRGNWMSGMQPLPATANTNCPNLQSGASPAIGLHFEHADWGEITDNFFTNMVNGVWFSSNGPDRWTIANNHFDGLFISNCDGAAGCLSTGVIGIGQCDGCEVYGNLITRSDPDWLDCTHEGNNCEQADVRHNLMIDSDAGLSGTLGTGSNVSHNANIGTATTGMGTNELLDVTLAQWAASTAFTTNQLVYGNTTPGSADATYEVQGNCTSGTTFNVSSTLDDDVSNGTCTFRVIRSPAVIKTRRWMNPTDIEMPFSVGGSASSPLNGLPGDVDQGCASTTGVSDNVVPGVTC